jgi:hypothetical protein
VDRATAVAAGGVNRRETTYCGFATADPSAAKAPSRRSALARVSSPGSSHSLARRHLPLIDAVSLHLRASRMSRLDSTFNRTTEECLPDCEYSLRAEGAHV